MPALAQLTTGAHFLAMCLSLWLGCYIVTRSPRSRLAWLSGLMLWSLIPVFLDPRLMIGPASPSDRWSGWTPILSIAFWYHFSLNTLPAHRRRRQRPMLYLTYGLGIALFALLVATPWLLKNPRLGLVASIGVYPRGPIYPVLVVYLLGLMLLVLYNFRQARRDTPSVAYRKQFNSLIRGTFLATVATAYWVTLTALNVTAPSLPLVLGIGIGVGWLGYGVVRYSALLEGRVVRYDFAFNGLLILGVVIVYLAAMLIYDFAHGLTPTAAVSIVALAIATHSVFDFARRQLDRLFLRKPEFALRAALRRAAAEVGEREAMEAGLRGALEGIVRGVDARWGAIALHQGGDLVVAASLNWKPIGERLPRGGLNVPEMTILPPDAADRPFADLSIIMPLTAEGEPLGVILIARPRTGPAYSEADLDLVAEAADHLAELIHRVQQQEDHAQEIARMLESFRGRERELQEKIETLRSPGGAEAISPEQIAEVEDALRRLYDYSYLGDHPLAARFVEMTGPVVSTGPATHIDRGKALNAALIAAVEKLRPAGAEPRDLPSRQWHPYLVLRDAYLNGDPNRDIMSRLYISEATFHRVRRQALRATAKALFEMGTPRS